MICLSMMQPFAWLFTHGVLTIDDRKFSTEIRGQVAIHASRSIHEPYWKFMREHLDSLPDLHAFDRGGFVGVANLTDCIAPQPHRPGQPADPRRSHFGAPGFNGLVFTDPEPRKFIPFAGRPGFFEGPSDIWDQDHKRELDLFSA